MHSSLSRLRERAGVRVQAQRHDPPAEVPCRLESLADIESAVWRELGLAVRDPGHDWRVAVLATVDGDDADARCVVLRDFDPSDRTLLVYTDSRSPKAGQVAANERGVLVLWSEKLGWQLRLKVVLSLETTGLRASSRWTQLKLTPAAHDYLSPLPPGTPINTPPPSRESREHFAVLAAQILSADWLELHADGHRRARFGASDATWITP